jgi:hypothetical protein
MQRGVSYRHRVQNGVKNDDIEGDAHIRVLRAEIERINLPVHQEEASSIWNGGMSCIVNTFIRTFLAFVEPPKCSCVHQTVCGGV